MSNAGIVLDNPTAKSVGGSGVDGNWTRSTNVPGYYGDDYQVHAATTGDGVGALDPRLPRAVATTTCTCAGPPRATGPSGSTVTVNTPSGPFKRWINQQVNGSRWISLGPYYFKAGYATGRAASPCTRRAPTATSSPTRCGSCPLDGFRRRSGQDGRPGAAFCAAPRH